MHNPEAEANMLFQQRSIGEIRAIEKQTRRDIERKKEELRQMVGERYRELIDAADTIADMRASVSKVVENIHHMEKECRSLHKQHQQHSVVASPSSKVAGTTLSRHAFFSLTAQIKLLVDLPEKLWATLESGHHLRAAQLCLLSRSIMTSLHQESPSSVQSMLKQFPILPRQWSAISHFPAIILQTSRAALCNAHLPVEKLEESLAAILLLEGCSLQQVFTEFLMARKTALQSLFGPEHQGQSVKALSCHLVWLVRTTIQQVRAVFIESWREGRSSTRLQSLVAETVHLSELHLGNWSRFLPANVRDFQPSISASLLALSMTAVHGSCAEWVDSCVCDVPMGLSKALGFVENMRSLARVRDAVHSLLSKENSNETGEVVCRKDDVPPWEDVCAAVLGRQMSIWDEFLRPHFVRRTMALIEKQLHTACKNVVTSVSSLLDSLPSSTAASSDNDELFHTTPDWADRHVSAFVWQESGLDLPSSVLRGGGKTQMSSRSSSVGTSSLTMKACGFTPGVAHLCAKFDSELATLADGLDQLVKTSTVAGTPTRRRPLLSGSLLDQTDKSPFDKFADASQLQSFLGQTSLNYAKRLVEDLSAPLEVLRKTVSSSRPGDDVHRAVDGCLLLGRTCSALSDHSPNFDLVLSGLKESPLPGSSRTSRTRRGMMRNLMIQEESSAGGSQREEVKALLRGLYDDSYTVWIEYVCNMLLQRLREILLSEDDEVALLYSMTWSDIKISEEGESDRKVESTISLPMQISSHVMCTVFALCEELSRIGGHAVSRSVLHRLVRTFGDGMLCCYEDLLGAEREASGHVVFTKKLAQLRALQVVFDVKCLATLLAGRGDSAPDYTKRVRQLTDWLDGCIDPFDMSVFEPHLVANMSRAVQRCSLLCGSLYSLSRGGANFVGGASAVAAAGTPSTSRAAPHHEQHNVMAMSAPMARLPLLPIGSGFAGLQPSESLSPNKQTDVPKAGEYAEVLLVNDRLAFLLPSSTGFQIDK